MTSSRIQEIVLDLLSDGQNHSVQEIKNHLKKINCDDYSEGQFAGSINTLQRNGSIKKIDRGVYKIKARSENMKKCFVVSPIGDEGSEIRINADKLFKYVITPVCEECDFSAIRVDQLNDANSITETIIENLENADLVLADISGHNPNVFYEIGYRSRTQKPIIHLKSKSEKLPFDINTIRTFEYDLTDLDSVEEIKKRLVKTINSFNFSEIEETNGGEDAEKVPNSILPMLYEISDKIDELKSEMNNVNADIIESVVKASTNAAYATRPESTEDLMTKMIMEQLLKNPSSADSLMALANKFSKANK